MEENLRFIYILDTLKKDGVLADYVEAATVLETNKAGISDIKSGRKKLSLELLRRLKSSYPSVSLDWIVMGEGEPFILASEIPSSADSTLFIEKIAEQAEEIGRLKAQIDELKRRRGDNAGDVRSSGIANVG